MSDNYPVDKAIERLEARIELMAKFIDVQEQAHAALAAEMAARFRDHSGMIVGVLEEVNRLRTRYEAHLLVHELDALESPASDSLTETPAQQRYREANDRHYSNREVEMAAGAFDRAEEVAQELDDWTHLIHMRLNTMSIRLTALESPAPVPDPVCQCGHPESQHFADFGCILSGFVSHATDTPKRLCTCDHFVPTAEPEPEPAPLDPVQKTVECTNCGHPVWFIAGENDPHPCTDCGTVNSREQPDIFAAEPMLNPISFTDGELAVIEFVLTNAKASATGIVGKDVRETLARVRIVRSAYGRDGAR